MSEAATSRQATEGGVAMMSAAPTTRIGVATSNAAAIPATTTSTMATMPSMAIPTTTIPTTMRLAAAVAGTTAEVPAKEGHVELDPRTF